jgi:AcrR family transcriptional regulator
VKTAADPVVASRPYRSALREEQARRTRAAVLDAATQCFTGAGWAATTMKDVARAAGVSVETVYAQGSKAALLLAVVDRTLAGDDEPVPLRDRPEARALRDETDARARFALLGAVVTAWLGPALPVLRAFRNAAATDPALAAAYAEYEQRRLSDVTALVEGLALRPGLTTGRAADVLWTLLGTDVAALLVDGRGWTVQAYADWLVDSLERLLLP